jgi:hypothetical protein
MTSINNDSVSQLSSEDKMQFKNLAMKYFQMDDKIKDSEKEVKKYKKERKEIEEKLIEFMQDNEIDDLKTDKGKLEYNVRHSKVGLSKKILQNKLLLWFKDDTDKATELVKFIDDRERVSKVSLKIKKL